MIDSFSEGRHWSFFLAFHLHEINVVCTLIISRNSNELKAEWKDFVYYAVGIFGRLTGNQLATSIT